MIFTEAGRTVTTNSQWKQISVSIRIVHFTEERDKWITFTGTVSLCRTTTCIGPHIIRSKDREVFFISGEMAVIFTVQLHTCHHVSTMLAYLQLISGNGIPHPFGPVFLFGFYCTLAVVGLCSFLIRISEVTGLFVSIVQTESRPYIQSFEKA